jgi:glycosyltransferase involved in cell wall biosynthesis
MNKKILIVSVLPLFPPRENGASIRYYPFVKELIKRGYQIDHIVINRYNLKVNIDKKHSYFNNIENINKTEDFKRGANFSDRLKVIIKYLTSLIPYNSISLNENFYLDTLEALLRTKERYPYCIAVGIESLQLLLKVSSSNKPVRIICDFIDSPTLLKKREKTEESLPKLIFQKVNYLKTYYWEKKLSAIVPSIYISKYDSNTASIYSEVIPNSVIDNDFCFARTRNLKHPSIGFVGNLNYLPNQEACLYLINTIFPQLIKVIPNITLYLVGKNASINLLNKGNGTNIIFTGEVENIWDYYLSIDVFVFPMLSGAGLQNKVLEAMYAGKDVICSSIANEGIDAHHGKQLFIADSAEDFTYCITNCIEDLGVLGKEAEKYVKLKFTLKDCVDKLEKLLRIA